MAIYADIILTTVNGRALTGATLMIPDSAIVDSDVITSSGTSQQSGFAVPAGSITNYVWEVQVVGGNIRGKFGTNPTAAAAEGGGRLMIPGRTYYFAATAGDKLAVITAEI